MDNQQQKTGTRKKAAGKTKKVRKGRVSRVKLIGALFIILLVIVGILRLAAYISSISRIHLTDEGLTHAIRFQNSAVVHGIDVSEYQGEINWKKVKSSGADFVFIRAGYRSSDTGELNEDANFRDNIKKANKAGLMCGAYFFSQALNEEEAVEEASYLLDLVDRYEIDMPLVIDYELVEGGRLWQAVEAGDMSYASIYHDIVLAFCSEVEDAGYESAVYANTNMLSNYMDSSILDDEVTIWAAQYGGTCHVKGDYLYWQCADDAAVSGIEGPVDHDIWYLEPGKVYTTEAAGKKDRTSIADCEISIDGDSCKLKNHRAKPKVAVTYNGKKLHEGKDYILTYVKNTEPGTGYAILRGTGRYKDLTSVPFNIE